MRCLLLIGGNAAGKSTVLRHIMHDNPSAPWLWCDPDSTSKFKFLQEIVSVELKVSKELQIARLSELWKNSRYKGIAITGFRIHSNVLTCGMNLPIRQFYIGILNQTYEAGITHLKNRCIKSNRTFNSAYWENPKNRRAVESAWSKNIRIVEQYRQNTEFSKLLVDVREWWMDEHFSDQPKVIEWGNNVVRTTE